MAQKGFPLLTATCPECICRLSLIGERKGHKMVHCFGCGWGGSTRAARINTIVEQRTMEYLARWPQEPK